MKCTRCQEDVPSDGDFVVCNGCKGKYHYECTTLSAGTYRNMSKTNKNSWRCPNCKGKKSSTIDSEQDDQPDSGKDSGVLQAINSKLNDISKELSDLRKSVEFMNNKYETMVNEIKELKDFKKQHLNTSEKMKVMEIKINEMEQREKMHNLEIKGIEEKEGENLKVTTVILATQMGVDMSRDDIETVYRVNNKSKTEPRDIIVKLKSLQLREKILQKKKTKVNNKEVTRGKLDKIIYVNEQLTPYNKMLFWEARKKTTEKGYKFAWVKNGNILVRKNEAEKVQRIQHQDDLKVIV